MLARRDEGEQGSVYLLIDCSASMSGGNKLLQAKLGAVRFAAEAWQRRYAVGIVSFSTSATCLLRARRAFAHLHKPLERLEANGRTAMAEGIDFTRKRLLRRRGHRVICLITDGQPDSREEALRAAALARASGVELIAVGTDGADESFLAAIAAREALGVKVSRERLAAGVATMAKKLPRGETEA